MTEPSPRLAEAVRVALEILEREGPDGLTMRAIGARMGIQAPSLYKHVEGKDELEALLIARPSAVSAAQAVQVRMRHRPGPVRAGAPRRPGAAREPPVQAGSADRARAAWAFAHGMTILEIDGRFPPGADLDAAWDAGLLALAR